MNAGGSIRHRDWPGGHLGDDASSQEGTSWPVATAVNASAVGRYFVPTRVTAITSVIARRMLRHPAGQGAEIGLPRGAARISRWSAAAVAWEPCVMARRARHSRRGEENAPRSAAPSWYS
jgi:hypothetical protein